MKKLFLSLVICLINCINPAISHADNINTGAFSTYVSPLVYLNSSRNLSVAVGGYGYFNIEKLHLFEASSSFNYLNSSSPVSLENLALSYSNFQLDNNSIRFGANILNTSYKNNDQGFVAFLGDNYNLSENFSAGLDVSASFYNYYTNFKPVLQINPSLVFSGGDFYSEGTFFVKLKGYYINIPDELAAGVLLLKRNCYSGEFSAGYNYFNIWDINFSAWAGSQVFAVRNNGFSVYNSPEEHFAGYGISAKYSLSEEMDLTLGLHNEHFIESSNQKNTMMISIPILINYNF
ncbi:MAG: hypothetical protein AABZ74_07550 [Cyanobacteriota bacterium]